LALLEPATVNENKDPSNIIEDPDNNNLLYTDPDANNHIIDEEGNSGLNIKDHQILVGPNPVINQINIQLKNEDITIKSIKISDITGKVLKEETYSDINKYKTHLQGNEFSKGIYFLTISTNKGSITKKIIKQ
jgi:hypothetical protein